MHVYGLMLASLVVLGARRCGYGWTAGGVSLGRGVMAFLTVFIFSAVASVMATIPDALFVVGILQACETVAAGIGWFWLFLAVAQIGKSPVTMKGEVDRRHDSSYSGGSHELDETADESRQDTQGKATHESSDSNQTT